MFSQFKYHWLCCHLFVSKFWPSHFPYFNIFYERPLISRYHNDELTWAQLSINPWLFLVFILDQTLEQSLEWSPIADDIIQIFVTFLKLQNQNKKKSRIIAALYLSELVIITDNCHNKLICIMVTQENLSKIGISCNVLVIFYSLF